MPKSVSFKLDITLLFLLLLSLIIRDQRFFIVVALTGTIFVVISGVKALLKKQISVDLLASIALVASLLAREWFSAVFINLMITSARIFGSYTESVAGVAIKSLLKLRPKNVKLKKKNGEVVVVPLSEVKVGDIVVVKVGDRVPVDGMVVDGSGSFDQSSLTGESIPVAKAKGDLVLSSTLNVSGSILVKAEKIGKDTTFEKIIKLVEDAGASKVHIKTLGQKFASWYITLSLLGSVGIYLATHNLSLVLAVLLVVCADDIAVAIPMAFWAAIGSAAKRGIIIKGASFLETMTKVKTLVVDKTGTLTRGKIAVTEVISFGGIGKDKILEVVASSESTSNHPIAKAITNYAKGKGVKVKIPEKYKEVPGRGMITTFEKEDVVVGDLDFIKDRNIKIKAKDKKKIDSTIKSGVNLIIIGLNQKAVGIITFEDDLRPKIKQTIEEIKRLGIDRVYMLTGDAENVAKRISTLTGIADYKANLMPEDKLKFIKDHVGLNQKLAMVGDGVNDAAALAASDVGISMGAVGSDVAIESSDIALMNDDFSKIKDIMEIGKKTINISKQNFVIWGVVNVIGLILVFGNVIGPSGAAAYNFITDFFPIINSLSILGLRRNS